MSDDTTGTLVDGRYEVVRRIGHGGGGGVWLARDTLLGRSVAIKQLGAFPGETGEQTARAVHEAGSTAELNHPNVVAVHDVIEHDEAPWLVMEYVAGPTLSTAVLERGPMTAKGAADLGSQLAWALAAAHDAGIVHRDVKPANVLIGGGRPKIGDFGIARTTVEEQLTQTGVVTGTPTYMSPEVAVGGRHTPAADVWSLGATIYYAVEGRAPFPRLDSPLATLQYIATNPPRPPQHAGVLEPVLGDMLSRDPARRGSMRDVARRLEHLAAGGHGSPQDGADEAGPAPATSSTGEEDSAGEVRGRAGPLREGEDPPRMEMVTEPVTPRAGNVLAWVVAIVLSLLLLTALALVVVPDDEGAAEPTTSASEEESTEAESPVETEPAITFVQAAGSFVTHYYGQAPKNPETTWEDLTPAKQEAVGGQSEYEDFWNGITSAETSDMVVDAEKGTVRLKVTYHRKNGKDQSEQLTLPIVEVGGQFKIDK